jgi:hypothetical protein
MDGSQQRSWPLRTEKKPRTRRGLSLNDDVSAYRFTPDPGPVGLSVEPLGEPLGASVLPDGFAVPSEMPLLMPVAMPVVEPGGFAVSTPFVTEPVVVPVVPEPVAAEPVAEPPAAVLPPALPLCARANVPESASAPANAIVVSFMDRFPSC